MYIDTKLKKFRLLYLISVARKHMERRGTWCSMQRHYKLCIALDRLEASP
jgi:hypothetical protein